MIATVCANVRVPFAIFTVCDWPLKVTTVPSSDQ